MRFMEIDLDGSVVRARLNEDRAPQTCQAIWDVLPFGGRAVHAQISGDMFRMIEGVPVGDLPLESPEYSQHPGQLVFYPPIKEIAFCVGKAQFSATQGFYKLTPLAEIEGDFTAWAKTGDDLQFSGTKRIEFRRAADQGTSFRYPTLTGRRLEIDFDGVKVPAALLDQENPKTASSFVDALPLSGRASNSTWAGGMTRFVPDGQVNVGVGVGEVGTTFHWPGYVYVDPRDGCVRIGYADAQENVQGVPVPLIPVARMDGDLAAYQAKARTQVLEGAKPMTIRASERP